MESFNLWKHTSLYENEHNEREIVEWRLILEQQQYPVDYLI